MKAIWSLLTAFLFISLWSCEPEPFKTELVGYSIEFPTTAGVLKKQYPKGDTIGLSRFVDSTQLVQAEWLFNAWGGNPASSDDAGKPYGVNIFLKNKGDQFNAIKTNLESKFHRELTLMPMPKLEVDPTTITPRVYACELSDDTILILTMSASHRGDPWSQYNTVRIGIGYNLKAKEKELFALKGGDIHDDD